MPFMSTIAHKSSFFVDVIPHWNSLPNETISCTSADRFIRHIHNYFSLPCLIFIAHLSTTFFLIYYNKFNTLFTFTCSSITTPQVERNLSPISIPTGTFSTTLHALCGKEVDCASVVTVTHTHTPSFTKWPSTCTR